MWFELKKKKSKKYKRRVILYSNREVDMRSLFRKKLNRRRIRNGKQIKGKKIKYILNNKKEEED